MMNKPKLLTIILTILFSVAVASVVWAVQPCIVDISPSNPVVCSDQVVTPCAITTGEGCSDPIYRWEITESDCTTSGSIEEFNFCCTYITPDTCGCVETIRVTDIANDGITAETTVSITHCCVDPPVVTITAAIPDQCVEQEFCAATTWCGEPIEGTYAWSVTGGTSNTTTGECINVIPSGKAFTVTATDMANDNAQDSVEGICRAIEATFYGCKLPLPIAWFGAVEIQPNGFEFTAGSIVNYDSPLVLKTPRLLNRRNQKITQFVLLMPSILFPTWDYPAVVIVSVDGFQDTIDIPKCGP